MQDFIQAIADEHVYLFDGAMGTMLYAKGVFINKCYDELNLRSPEIVLEVHKQYVRAGAEVLRDAGVDLFVLETISNIAEVEQGILAIRDICSLPIVTQMTIGNDGRTIYGDSPRTIAERLDRAGADVIGLNCSVGPDVMLDAIEEISAVTAKKISCQPNAGL